MYIGDESENNKSEWDAVKMWEIVKASTIPLNGGDNYMVLCEALLNFVDNCFDSIGGDINGN